MTIILKMNDKFTKLPQDLPVPKNDGKASHLLGRKIPNIILPSTKNNFFNLSAIGKKYGILYFFPMMSMSEKELPSGWNDIPGARGCTPQNISITKHVVELEKHDAMPIGISSQPIAELEQLSSERNFSQILVSDNKLEFQKKLNVPVFTFDGNTLYRRLTLVVKNSKIVKVFYPVFPPDEHIFEILKWLEKENEN